MLATTDLQELASLLQAAAPAPRFPPITDRVAWGELAARLGDARVAALIRQAEEDAATPIPPLPATLFLEFDRTGRREGYETPMGQRRYMLAALAVAECLEDQGRFLDPILDVAWAICEESSWAAPAHQSKLADVEHPYLDLFAAMTALELAEADALVGAKLDPRLGKRIRTELDRRCFTPYLERDDFWWLICQEGRAANWTAVCSGSVVGAALWTEADPARLAALLGRAITSMSSYLATFDQDGGSSEGPGYWDYGFGHYTILADLVHWRTDGALDLLGGDRLRQIASYPLRTVLSRGHYVNFSDCDATVTIAPAHLHYLAGHLAHPDFAALARQQPPHHPRTTLTWMLRDLFWTPTEPGDDHFVPARHDWFGGMMWMVARVDPADPDALVLAAKGGNNHEMHNQNDVGNFIVHVNGESIIPDVGRGRYTRDYFGLERYEYFVNSSTGHSVPMPNGVRQSDGPAFAAQLLAHQATDDADRLFLDLTHAYPVEADLAFLRREICLHRDGPRGWVELVDEAEFATAPGQLVSALTTFGDVELGDGGLVIHGARGALRVSYDDSQIAVEVELYQAVDLALAPRDIRRLLFFWHNPQPRGRIRLEMVPL